MKKRSFSLNDVLVPHLYSFTNIRRDRGASLVQLPPRNPVIFASGIVQVWTGLMLNIC